MFPNQTPAHHVPSACEGETCKCGQPATHKIEEVVFPDEPQPRHPAVRYVCCLCFAGIMGTEAARRCFPARKEG